MSNQVLGLIIGGVLPALFFALTAVPAKLSQQISIDFGSYVISIGLGVVATGVVLTTMQSTRSLPMQGFWYSFALGVAWVIGMLLFTLGLGKFGLPLSKLAPLHSFAPLIAIIFGFVIFGEWQHVKMWSLLAGAALMISGSILVARS